MTVHADQSDIRTQPRPDCFACGALGTIKYPSMKDRWYGLPGTWSYRQCSNHACQLVWQDPVPLKEDTWKIYQTYYTHEVASSRDGPITRLIKVLRDAYLRSKFGYTQGVEPGWSRYLAPASHLVSTLFPGGRDLMDDGACYLRAPKPGARFLEIGFGSGDRLARMRQLGWDVSGLDLDPSAVEDAKARGIDARLGELDEQSFPDAHFDAIYLSHVIEHVHDPLDLLRQCHRVLKPKGVVVVLTPNLASWSYRSFGSDWFWLDPPRHLVLFSVKSLGALAERAGLSVMRLDSSARLAMLVGSASGELRRFGRIRSTQWRPSAIGVIRALGYQLIGSLFLCRRRNAGDEVLLIAGR
jgi:SAM-dependent methyltransferase